MYCLLMEYMDLQVKNDEFDARWIQSENIING